MKFNIFIILFQGDIRDWNLYYIDDSYYLHRLNGALYFADNFRYL